MRHSLQTNCDDDVKQPQLLTDAGKRWRVISTAVHSIGASSLARGTGLDEGDQDVELKPIFIDSQKRWRAFYMTLRSIRAFYQARSIVAENQIELRDNLLQSPSHTVVDVLPERLAELVRLKNMPQLRQLGGVEGVASILKTDAGKGIRGDDEDIVHRSREFGSNTIQKPTDPKKHFYTVFETLRDPIIIILLTCAALSLGFGMKHHGLEGLSDGGSIFVAVFIVITVTTLSKMWSTRQFFRLSKARDNFSIFVLRNGQEMCISVFEAVVGDIVCLKTGYQVPADGLYINGNSLRIDESNMTAGMESVEVNESHNPFLLSGTKVIHGSARMLVTAVGINTEWGKILSSEGYETEESTPLQKELHDLTMRIAKVGLVVSFLVLIVLLLRYFFGNMHNNNGKSDFTAGKTRIHQVCNAMIGILATPLAIAATAIPEGLLLAVMITIAYSTKRMASQQALVRNLSACEAMGSVTVICTDERGNLTLNQLKVSEYFFGDKQKEGVPQSVLELLFEGMLFRNVEVSSASPVEEITESQIHSAIQEWVVQDMGINAEHLRANCKRTDKNNLEHQKGEPQVILTMCSHYYDEGGLIKDLSTNTKENFQQIFQQMESRGLRCIAFAHKDIAEEHGNGSEDFNPTLKEEKLIFIGIVGLKYQCRPEVRKAVMECKGAGVNVKLVTRNDLTTARAVAIECGIIEPTQDMTTEELVDRQVLQNNAEEEIIEKCDKIRVLARASTLDKIHMVRGLKQRGLVVAVTGHSIGDASVLREASVGLSLAIQGTPQAKENSDIIILDDNFDSVTRLLRWGRAIYHNIQIYAQFQLTVSISSLVIDFVTAVSASEPPTINIVAAISAGKVPYATFQVLWVKLIVGTLAALAITIEEPAEELRQLHKADHVQPFITSMMWKNILGQALYPMIVLLIIQFKGQSIFNLDTRTKDTMIFNIFVLWQLFVLRHEHHQSRRVVGLCHFSFAPITEVCMLH